jgi:hypothetical protein
MWPVIYYLSFRACHADAPFVWSLRRPDEPEAGPVRRAIEVAIRAAEVKGG